MKAPFLTFTDHRVGAGWLGKKGIGDPFHPVASTGYLASTAGSAGLRTPPGVSIVACRSSRIDSHSGSLIEITATVTASDMTTAARAATARRGNAFAGSKGVGSVEGVDSVCAMSLWSQTVSCLLKARLVVRLPTSPSQLDSGQHRKCLQAPVAK